MKAYIQNGNLIIEAQTDQEAQDLTDWRQSRSQPIVNTHWYKVFKKQLQEITEVDLEQMRASTVRVMGKEPE